MDAATPSSASRSAVTLSSVPVPVAARRRPALWGIPLVR